MKWILSHKKDTLINLNKVGGITVYKKQIAFSDNISSGKCILLETYKTEERAEEVLQKIITYVEDVEYKGIFEMPKE